MGTELQDQVDRERWERYMAAKRWLQMQMAVVVDDDSDDEAGIPKDIE